MTTPTQLADLVRQYGQDHLAAHLATLNAEERAVLVADLLAIEWTSFPNLLASLQSAGPETTPVLEPAPTIVKGADPHNDQDAADLGKALLHGGRVAVFVVAGGQGSRLGYEGPKGMYPATPIRGKSLFQVFAEKIQALGRRFGAIPPWYVMTSKSNHAATVSYFESNHFFGLGTQNVRFFSQDMLPALDLQGRLLLASPTNLFFSPNGHGGSLLALRTSGALAEMKQRGIEEIFYFQVDNPLVVMADPVFLGYHAQNGADMSSKVVAKRNADEKVGVLGLIDGKYGVIEYSDLSAREREARDTEGRLKFSAGNIAVHMIKRSFVESITEGGLHLPYHLAKKTIPVFDSESRSPAQIAGVKFETFVFDALRESQRSVVLEVNRGEEFAPIKNASGEDSPATSRAAQSALFGKWLEKAGINVPRDVDGAPIAAIEISPLFADHAEAVESSGLCSDPAFGQPLSHDWYIE